MMLARETQGGGGTPQRQPAAGRVKSGKSLGNGCVGRAVVEPKHSVGACSLLNTCVGEENFPQGRGIGVIGVIQICHGHVTSP